MNDLFQAYDCKYSIKVVGNNNNNNNNRTIPNNKPGIVIQDNEKRTYILIDVAISGDSNVIKKEAEKF